MTIMQIKPSGLPLAPAVELLGPMPITPPPAVVVSSQVMTAGASAVQHETIGLPDDLKRLPLEVVFRQRYTILETLGGDAHAVCVRVQANDGVVRVAKRSRLPRDARGQQRVMREIRALARLHHPHIVRGVEAFDASEVVEGSEGRRIVVEPRFWLVQEEVSGSDLTDFLDPSRRLAIADIVAIRDQMADALAHCHANGVLIVM